MRGRWLFSNPVTIYDQQTDGGGNLFCQFLLLFDEFLMEGYLSRISLPTRAPAHVSILIISFRPFIANKHGCHFDIII